MNEQNNEIDRFEVPEDELVFTSAKSGGKGGQNVNARETKIVLRWQYIKSKILSEDQQKLISAKLENRINDRGEVVLSYDRERSQNENKKQAINNLNKLIFFALDPETERIPTKTPWSEKEKRLQDKHHATQKKQSRKKMSPKEYQ